MHINNLCTFCVNRLARVTAAKRGASGDTGGASARRARATITAASGRRQRIVAQAQTSHFPVNNPSRSNGGAGQRRFFFCATPTTIRD